MPNKRFFQTNMGYMVLPIVALILFVFSACGGGASETVAPAGAPAAEEVEVEEAMEEEASQEAIVVEQETDAEPADEANGAGPVSNLGAISNRPNVFNRLIIKNAEVEMLVEDTDTFVNRSLGVVVEYSGYVVSNRAWFTDGDQKHATLTIGVPSENFEEMLRRLKDMAITITDESVSGQDVTDEFVDLDSRLTNLEATAARIRDFLAQAQTVEESLRVNTQLSNIEAEIEQVKGRMAYLKERAAFSTITLQISPQIIVPTPTPSPTPTPTATPIPWSAGQTFNKAATVSSNAARSLFQTGVDLTIWFVIVYLPFILPIAILIWVGIRVLRRVIINATTRPPTSQQSQKVEGQS